MFLRSHTRKRNGTVYEYWTLEESVRTKERKTNDLTN